MGINPRRDRKNSKTQKGEHNLVHRYQIKYPPFQPQTPFLFLLAFLFSRFAPIYSPKEKQSRLVQFSYSQSPSKQASNQLINPHELAAMSTIMWVLIEVSSSPCPGTTGAPRGTNPRLTRRCRTGRGQAGIGQKRGCGEFNGDFVCGGRYG